MYRVPNIIVEASRILRKNMTSAERSVWTDIRNKNLGYKILRQKPIYVYTEDSGHHRFIIADFYIHELKLIIEIDGSIHNRKDIYHLDRIKEQLLQQGGYTIIRFTNDQILDNPSIITQNIINFLP